MGTLEFKKVKKETDLGLKNAEIAIYNADDELIYQGNTLDDGTITLNNLRYGKYYIIEKMAPLGYVKNTEPIWFNIQNNGEIVNVTLENELITNKIVITKKDKDTKEVLKDAKISIYNLNDELVYTGKTDENGQIILDLDYGEYYLIEQSAPLGYNLYTDKINFKVENADDTINIELLDEKIKGTLKIIKTDYDTLELLSGSEFSLYDTNDNLITSGLTNLDGELIINDLKYGNYYLVEAKASEGYLLNSGQIPFTIKENGKVVTVEVPNHEVPKPRIFNVPKTSDNSNLWLNIFSIFMLMIGIRLIYEKKH